MLARGVEALRTGLRRSLGRVPEQPSPEIPTYRLLPRLAKFLNGDGTFTTPTVQLRETGETDQSGQPVLEKVVEVGYTTTRVPIHDESTGHTIEGVYREPFIATGQEIQDAKNWLNGFKTNHYQIWQKMERVGRSHELPSKTVIELRLLSIEGLLQTRAPQTVLFEN